MKSVKLQDCSLAILSGGASKRLGTDKGLFRPVGQRSLIVNSLEMFGDKFSKILIVVRDEEQKSLYEQEIFLRSGFDRQKVKVISDLYDEMNVSSRAAAVGIYSALKSCETSHLIAMAVDQVALRAVHLNSLVGGGDYFFSPDDPSDLAPLPSLWKKDQLEKLELLIQSGCFSIKSILRELDMDQVQANPQHFEEIQTNANTLDQMKAFFGTPLKDRFDRRMHYLRFSLTEVCNMQCHYCLPEGNSSFLRQKTFINQKEIQVVLRAFRNLGFRKVRFTGGEPTAHPSHLKAIEFARQVGFEEITMTTNASLIKNMADYVNAGLTAVNISMDSIDERLFFELTKSNTLKNVLKVIDQSCELGLKTKINTVLMRNKNGSPSQIESLIDYGLDRPLTLRFIELMPTGLNQSFDKTERVLGSEIEPLLLARELQLIREPSKLKSFNTYGPATVYSNPRFPGKIGLINPLSCNFCSACNRLRVNAHGQLRLCLFETSDIPLDLQSVDAIVEKMRYVIFSKSERHHLEDRQLGNVDTFRTIGG